jgi:hypothetical protein
MNLPDDARREGERAPAVVPSDARAPFGRASSTITPVEPDVGVRPYYVTRGRTRTDRPLGIEVLVQTSAFGLQQLGRLRFEQQAIAAICRSPVSVAEVAARADLPLGVVRVLIADMAGASLLDIHDTPTRIQDDISLIQRLIHGVREL